MEHRIFGKTGLSVSVLGFGASEIGGSDEANVDALLGAALDAGLNVIDTGECYKNSEELLGKTVSHRRSDYHLFTKVGHTSGLPGKDWDPDMLRASIDRSLKRLNTDHLDLLQLHSCDLDVLRRGDAIAVVQKARDAGKTRFIGYSGDHADAEYAIECGAFDSLQTSVNAFDQQSITLTLPKANAANMGVIAKRPIGNVCWHNGDLQPTEDYPMVYWRRQQKLKYTWADPLDMNNAVSTALRFTLAQPGVCTAIVGTQNPKRWVQNAALLNSGPLDEGIIAAIKDRWSDVVEADWIGQQ